jgi:UDP-GlcNAc:undecaprenyl-phosphate GlcNAc-1-phosphate transferase
MEWNPSATLIAVLAAFSASMILTLVVRKAARRFGVLAYPDSVRRFHTMPVPLLGGIAIYAALVFGLMVVLLQSPKSSDLATFCWAFIPTTGMACFFGAIDDCRNLSPRMKLLLQLCSITPVVAAGYRIEDIAIFCFHFEFHAIGIPLTILWLLGCINALNLIDGMDGLASVVGVSTATMLGIIALNLGNGYVATTAFLLAATLLGFLIFNLPPASIFLGDSGSTMIGLIVGILGIQARMKSSATLAITAPAVIMTLPLFDVVMAVVRRKLTGRPLDVGDREHIHHCLLERGLGHWQVLAIVGSLCLTTGAAATAATFFRTDAVAWVVTTTLIFLMIRLRLFGHHEFGLIRGAIRHRLSVLGNWILQRHLPGLPSAEDSSTQALELDENKINADRKSRLDRPARKAA